MAGPGSGQRDYGESLPWLEPVEAERGRPVRRRPSKGGAANRIMLVLVVGVLIAFVVAAIVFFVLGRSDGDGPAGLIKAPVGPYKVPTDQVGGMNVEGQGDRTYATSQGDDTPSTIDLSALPEAPMTDREATPAIAPRPAPAAAAPVAKTAPPVAAVPTKAPPPKPEPVKAAPPKPAPPKPAPVEAPVTGGTIQLGAFSSEGKAKAAWSSLSKRFAALGGLSPAIVPVAKDGGTLYRLRAAAGGQAGSICAKLRVAGDSCTVVGN